MSTNAATIATYSNPTMIATTIMTDGTHKPINMDRSLFMDQTQIGSTTCYPPNRALLEGEFKYYNIRDGILSGPQSAGKLGLPKPPFPFNPDNLLTTIERQNAMQAPT